MAIASPVRTSSRRPPQKAALIVGATFLVIDKASAANFVPVNTADNWLHLLLGAGMIGLGLILADRAGDGLRARRAA